MVLHSRSTIDNNLVCLKTQKIVFQETGMFNMIHTIPNVDYIKTVQGTPLVCTNLYVCIDQLKSI